MNKNSATSNVQKCETGWGLILTDAEIALQETTQRARRLKRIVADIQNRIKEREPLPDYLKKAIKVSTQN